MTGHASHELLHAVAALILVVGGGVIVLRAWRQRQFLPVRSVSAVAAGGGARSITVAAAVLVAGLSLGAAAIHLAAAPAHLEELGMLGNGFLVAAAFQGAWAMAWLVRRGDRLGWIGVGGNASISAAWLLSRTTGLPIGPAAWRPESIGAPDAIATLFQVLIVALLVAHLMHLEVRIAGRVRDVAAAATIAVVPAIGVVFLATTFAVGVAAGGHDHDVRPNGVSAGEHSHSDGDMPFDARPRGAAAHDAVADEAEGRTHEAP